MRHTMAVLCVLLGACSSTPDVYEARSWARTELEQAQEECHVLQQRNEDVGFSTCMRSKGWYRK